MAPPPGVAQWTHLVATPLPHLRRPPAPVLALWSLGLVLARSWGLTAVSVFVASRQERQALAVEAGFAPLLRWVLHWWQGAQLALALDATTLGDRFVVLAISVLCRGCATPVA